MRLTKEVVLGACKLDILTIALLAAMARSTEVACSFEGATMNMSASSTHAGSHLALLCDATDKGDDPAAWANAHEIAAAVPTDGTVLHRPRQPRHLERYALSPADLLDDQAAECDIRVIARCRCARCVPACSSSAPPV